ncbi:MAG: glycosyltransferase [Acidimicrobiia bacterium]
MTEQDVEPMIETRSDGVTAVIDKSSGKRILVVSTFPPTQCGIATFTRALLTSASDSDEIRSTWRVARLVPEGDNSICLAPEMVVEVDPGSVDWAEEIADLCHDYDLLWIQHEYGIFGPDDGARVLELCALAPIPVVVTVHTVPADPTPHQREILEEMGRLAARIVVMSNEARRRLVRLYAIDAGNVEVIPHGATVLSVRVAPPPPGQSLNILNWGLIGPGKGLEWAIRSLPLLRHLEVPPRLVITGATHPNVRRREGEAYRDHLMTLASDLGVEAQVEMEDRYLPMEDLNERIRAAHIALLPYDSREQVTSGVLVEALAAGLPVIATAFPHAVETLSGGAGVIVPHRDPPAIARAIDRFATNPAALVNAASYARRIGLRFSWPRVAARYDVIATGEIKNSALTLS